ncbi:hypothetical protein HUJ05_004680 [Dendroctonus ponderosae]|nr:hypothetical protein HUJ05_004680 [Dendroctonus ponderosae]
MTPPFLPVLAVDWRRRHPRTALSPFCTPMDGRGKSHSRSSTLFSSDRTGASRCLADKSSFQVPFDKQAIESLHAASEQNVNDTSYKGSWTSHPVSQSQVTRLDLEMITTFPDKLKPKDEEIYFFLAKEGQGRRKIQDSIALFDAVLRKCIRK